MDRESDLSSFESGSASLNAHFFVRTPRPHKAAREVGYAVIDFTCFAAGLPATWSAAAREADAQAARNVEP